MLRILSSFPLFSLFAAAFLASLAGGASTESLSVDLGNDSAFPAEAGWVNMTVQPVNAGAANQHVAVPLKKNGGEASSSPVAFGSLFGRTVRLKMTAASSVGNFSNLVSGGLHNWMWKENGKYHTNKDSAVAGATSQFNLPNNCEAFTTSIRVLSNGQSNQSATGRLIFSGLAPGKAYTVTLYLGTESTTAEAVTLVSGTSVGVRPLGTSQGTLSGTTFTGAANTTTDDMYLVVEWTAQADLSGELVFDVLKRGQAGSKGHIDINALTIATDDTPAPVLPDPKPVASIHNKALTVLPAPVTLPVPLTTWNDGGTMTCELWVRPDEDAANGTILSLGSLDLRLKDGRLCLDDETGTLALTATVTNFEAGAWHHVAVSLGSSNIKLFIDGAEAASSEDSAAFAAAMRTGWEGLELAAGFAGARDEIRFWDIALNGNADENQSDFWRHGPLAMGHPKYAHLVGNWRLDGNFRDVKWTEFAPRTGSPFTTLYPALTPANAEFAIVSDNDTFRYKVTAGYVRDTHVIYRWISRAHLINNSDLIYIGGATVRSDGSIAYVYPDNDVTNLASSGAEFLAADGGRTNLYHFPEAGPGMRAGNDLLTGCNAGAADTFTIEANLLLSADAENAVLFENDQVVLKLIWNVDHYRAFAQIGTDAAWEADLPAGLAKNAWFWLAFVRNKGDNTAAFYYNNNAVETRTATVGALEGTAETVLGRGFVGKIDEMRVWFEKRKPEHLGQTILHAWADRLLRAHWGDSDVPGRDTASWAEHLRQIRKLTEGVEGIRIRFDVAGGAWQNLLRNEGMQQNFAASIADALAQYKLDGVDLDFEWIYNSGDSLWTGYGKTAQTIRAANPETVLTISPHTIAYWFPRDAMGVVDYFTFQNYGPSINVNSYDSMVSACANFRKQGFPDEKILLSGPFQGTSGSNPAGYRDFAHEDAVADPDCDVIEFGGRTLHYNGVTTIKKKTKYIADQKLAGFMYWDNGLDIADGKGQTDYFHERSLLRAVSRYNGSTAYPVTPAVFALDRAGVSFPASASTAAIEVQTEDATLGWVVAEKPDWISVDPSGSISDASVTLSAAANPSAFERTGSVRFVASATNQECVCVVTQAADRQPTGFDKWKKKHFPGGDTDPDAAPGANPAHDGITNLLKYALGLDPHRKYGSPGVPTVSSPTPPATLTVTYPRNDEATDILYSGERLADPDDVSKGWTTANVTTDTTTPGKVSVHCELQNSVDSPKQILRLRVKRIEPVE